MPQVVRHRYVLRVRETRLTLVGPFPNQRAVNKWIQSQRIDDSVGMNNWHIVMLSNEEAAERLIVLHPALTGVEFLAAA